jgi:acetyl esterase/lipase
MFRILLFIVLLHAGYCKGQEEIALYPGQIPNARAAKNEEYKTANAEVDTLTYKVSVPTLSVFLPTKGTGNGTAVIICPGGGYHVLLTKREGSDVAKAFNKLGITAFVLKYRLPDDRVLVDKTIGPLQDAQQALKLVRKEAKKWNVNPDKIGIMGFSAGGHLAATAGTHFNAPVIENEKKVSVRPDFMLLINPVISFTDEIGHIGSRDNLLGKLPSAEKIRFFSNELQVSAETPPTFLAHSGADQVVSVQNSLTFYTALQANHVPAALHIYAKGEHGFLTAPSFEEWFGRCIFWMKSLSLL